MPKRKLALASKRELTFVEALEKAKAYYATLPQTPDVLRVTQIVESRIEAEGK